MKGNTFYSFSPAKLTVYKNNNNNKHSPIGKKKKPEPLQHSVPSVYAIKITKHVEEQRYRSGKKLLIETNPDVTQSVV